MKMGDLVVQPAQRFYSIYSLALGTFAAACVWFYSDILAALSISKGSDISSTYLRWYLLTGALIYIWNQVFPWIALVKVGQARTELGTRLEGLRLSSPWYRLLAIFEGWWKFLVALVAWLVMPFTGLIVGLAFALPRADTRRKQRLSVWQPQPFLMPLITEIVVPPVSMAVISLLCLATISDVWSEEYTRLLPLITWTATVSWLFHLAVGVQTLPQVLRANLSSRLAGYGIFLIVLLATFAALTMLLPVVFTGVPPATIDFATWQATANKILGLGSLLETATNVVSGTVTPFEIACLVSLLLFATAIARFAFQFEAFQRSPDEDALQRVVRALQKFTAGEAIDVVGAPDRSPVPGDVMVHILKDLQARNLGRAIDRLRSASTAHDQPAGLDECFLVISIHARGSEKPMPLVTLFEWGLRNGVSDKCLAFHALQLPILDDQDVLDAVGFFNRERELVAGTFKSYSITFKWMALIALRAIDRMPRRFVSPSMRDNTERVLTMCNARLAGEEPATRIFDAVLPLVVDLWSVEAPGSQIDISTRWRGNGAILGAASRELVQPIDAILCWMMLSLLRRLLGELDETVATEMRGIERQCSRALRGGSINNMAIALLLWGALFTSDTVSGS
jgi:hypothetical protein